LPPERRVFSVRLVHLHTYISDVFAAIRAQTKA
jgi:hypothetical protein